MSVLIVPRSGNVATSNVMRFSQFCTGKKVIAEEWHGKPGWTRSHEMLNNPNPKILITRLSHIGDCILTMPMLTAIRQAIPGAQITWAVETPTQQLLKCHPDLNDVLLVPKGWMKKFACWPKLFRDLRAPKFDIVIDPQGITKSAALGWISGAPLRIGIRGQWGRELSPLLNNRLVVCHASHLVDRTLELLKPLDISNVDTNFNLAVCPDSAESIQLYLDREGLNERFVVINPGASWLSKRWETERFASVTSYLHQHHGIRSVVTWAGQAELAMANQIVALNPSASLLAPATSLLELAALCAKAYFFVGCDTGPLHLATAMGTLCIGLYGPTRPEQSGAYGPQHIAIQKRYQSGSCRQRRQATNDAMREISSADVNAACDRMCEKLGEGTKNQSVPDSCPRVA